jgi:hypothetical protein
MSDARILYPQFRDEQADSRYPFADRATLASSTAGLEIGRDTFIDASIYTINGDRQAYISAIVVTPQLITIYLGDVGDPRRASAEFNPLAAPADGVLNVFDIYGRPAGMLLSTPLALARFSGWPTGTHTFLPAAAEFVSSVVIPAREPGVRGLVADDAALLTGDVWIVGGRGVVVRKEDEEIIRVDIIGEPLFNRYLCDPVQRFAPKTFLQSITVNRVTCGPNEYGGFNITATDHGASDSVLRIYPQDGNIKIDTIGRKVV